MNIRKIILEEINDFEWTDDLDAADITKASRISMKYNPVLTDRIFDEVKHTVTHFWNAYDNQFGYVDEKMAVVDSLPKTWGSVLKMIHMFHPLTQREIFDNLSDETMEPIKLEMYDRGWTANDF